LKNFLFQEAEKAEREKALADRKRDKSKLKANSIQIQATLDDFRASPEDPIPVFLKRAITFIEKEGLDAEGLYRVPGNRAHVDLLFQVISRFFPCERSEGEFRFSNGALVDKRRLSVTSISSHNLKARGLKFGMHNHGTHTTKFSDQIFV